MINLKSKKGITVAALTITILLFLMILSTITFSSLSSVQIKKLNNMYSDIISLQEKIDLYYLKNGVLPVQDGSSKITYSAENASDLKWLPQKVAWVSSRILTQLPLKKQGVRGTITSVPKRIQKFLR